MLLAQRLAESRHPRKKQKTRFAAPSPFEMALFAAQPKSSHYLSAPLALSRKPSRHHLRSRDEIDDFLSSDLEASFASTVSLNSPPRDPVPLSRHHAYAEPMDISPAPPAKPSASRLPSLDHDNALKPQGRPRAFTSAARLFGHDLSNTEINTLSPSPSLAPAPTLKSSAGSTYATAKKTQRSALPTEWFAAPQAPPHSIPPSIQVPPSPTDDAMDVDTSYNQIPQSAAPTITPFNHLFFETTSPHRSPAGSQIKKRRSYSPERSFTLDAPSSPMPMDSPSQSKPETYSSNTLSSRLNKPTLVGLGAPSASFAKRPRRPVVSETLNSGHPASALPTLTINVPEEEEPSPRESRAPPVRRAFSALIPPSGFLDSFSDESFEGPDMSSPAHAYQRRQQTKTLRRRDGTEDFKPLTGGAPPVLRDSPSSKFTSAGLPGFGDNEAHGKILPCHRVREDGLMRICPQTLDDLLDGRYDPQIVDYHVIDCRFDYEYAGGHIAGAVNINTTSAVEELLLGPSLTKPRPSVSGDSARKTILVFHCEFSAKRAPTFAKHLRAKDRAMNNHVYPKIHFPEVYILEGGYCQYYKSSGGRCEGGYVTMDDPTHAASRREDLDQFRKAKFGRHKSYAYGDGLGKLVSSSSSSSSSSSQQTKRNTAPPTGPNPVFAAANAARSRRGGGALMTLPEDNSGTADGDETDTDLGDSPCPAPTKNAALKNKRIGRGSLMRAETYAPLRMAY